MASPRPSDVENAVPNGVAFALAGALQRMIEHAARLQLREALRLQEQEAERRLQEALRLQEGRAASALREAVRGMEQQLRERDEAISALRHSLDERMQRLEAILRVREASEETGGRGALEQLQVRMGRLEEAVQSALSRVFPRVEALVAQLEKPSPPGALCAAPSTSTAPQLPATSALGAPAAAEDEERERHLVELRMDEVWMRRDRAESSPSSLSEALCRATFEGRMEDVRRLLDSGADANYVSCDGASPLISTFYVQLDWGSGNADVVSLLLERGADVNAVDENGCTALYYAAIADSCECVALLIAAGADVNARDLYGVTPLHRVAAYGHGAVVRALLAAGARQTIRCWSGEWIYKTPFEIAESDAVRNLLRP